VTQSTDSSPDPEESTGSELADDPESYGGLSIEDDPDGTVDPADLAGTADESDDQIGPAFSEADDLED
jgi:hypothetical protein